MVTKIGAASGMITPDERSEKRAVRELVHCIKMQETTVLVNYDERESVVSCVAHAKINEKEKATAVEEVHDVIDEETGRMTLQEKIDDLLCRIQACLLVYHAHVVCSCKTWQALKPMPSAAPPKPSQAPPKPSQAPPKRSQAPTKRSQAWKKGQGKAKHPNYSRWNTGKKSRW
jgi:hypothetical protein